MTSPAETPTDTNAAPPESGGLLAIDVGNTRVKLGWFASPDADCVASAGAAALPIAGPALPEPIAAEGVAADALSGAWLAEVFARHGLPARVAIVSVSRTNASRIEAGLPAGATVARLAGERAPIVLDVAAPERIGVDRVMAAVAANRLRRPDAAAIVVDVGTAITVDLVTPDGVLGGGAILPGPTLATRALADGAEALPDIRMGDLDASPDAVGRDTESAIAAGVFWGTVGAVRELIARQRDRLTAAPQVFLTGGASPAIARLVGGPDLAVRHVPDLTLSGIAIAARALATDKAADAVIDEASDAGDSP